MEGEDDERFFEIVIKPILEKEYSLVQFWQYSQKKKEKVNSYLNSIRSMQVKGIADFIVVADLDDSPCVSDKKERVSTRFRGLSSDAANPSETRNSFRILVVCREIESWYLAGLSDSECKRLGITTDLSNTNNLTKELFLGQMPQSYKSKAEFMLEILQVFDHETAPPKTRPSATLCENTKRTNSRHDHPPLTLTQHSRRKQ